MSPRNLVLAQPGTCASVGTSPCWSPGAWARLPPQRVLSVPAQSLPLPCLPGDPSPFLPGPTPRGVSILIGQDVVLAGPPLCRGGEGRRLQRSQGHPHPHLISFLCYHKVPSGTQQAGGAPLPALSALLQPVHVECWAVGLRGVLVRQALGLGESAPAPSPQAVQALLGEKMCWGPGAPMGECCQGLGLASLGPLLW